MRLALLLSQEFVRSHPADAARILERLPVAPASALLESLPATAAALGLRSMVATSGADCLGRIGPRRAAAILGELPPAVAAQLLLRLGPQRRETLLGEMPPKEAAALGRLLRFRPGTAGALAEPRVLSFAEETSAGQALARLRQSPPPAHDHLYVVDRDERLLGALTLRELMVAPPRSPLASLMDPRAARLPASADRAAILAHEGWRQSHALAVVDGRGCLLGVVGHETLRHLESEAGTAAADPTTASLGLAFADLCWIGMTKIVGGVAQAAFRVPLAPGEAEQGDRHER